MSEPSVSDNHRLVCHGAHLANDQFSHEPAEMVAATLGNGKTGLRCPECGTVVEQSQEPENDQTEDQQ